MIILQVTFCLLRYIQSRKGYETESRRSKSEYTINMYDNFNLQCGYEVTWSDFVGNNNNNNNDIYFLG